MRRDARGRPPDVSAIAPKLLVGEYLRANDVDWLKATHAVTAVVSLQHESDLWAKGISLDELTAAYRRAAIEFRRIPVEDYNEVDLAAALPQAVAALHELVSAGHTTYIHCNAGYNRAPTVVIAYLSAHGAMPLADAVELVKARRACLPYVTLLRKHFR